MRQNALAELDAFTAVLKAHTRKLDAAAAAAAAHADGGGAAAGGAAGAAGAPGTTWGAALGTSGLGWAMSNMGLAAAAARGGGAAAPSGMQARPGWSEGVSRRRKSGRREPPCKERLSCVLRQGFGPGNAPAPGVGVAGASGGGAALPAPAAAALGVPAAAAFPPPQPGNAPPGADGWDAGDGDGDGWEGDGDMIALEDAAEVCARPRESFVHSKSSQSLIQNDSLTQAVSCRGSRCRVLRGAQ